MKKRLLPLIAATLSLSVIGVADAAAARCPGKNSVLPRSDRGVVVKRSGKVVVVRGKKKGAVYACSSRVGKLRRIDNPAPNYFGPYQKTVRIAGNFVAIVNDATYNDIEVTALYIVNVRTGKSVRIHWDYPEPSSLVLSRAGTAAWILKDTNDQGTVSVYSAGPNWRKKPRLLDRGPTIVADKLRMDAAGKKVFWFRGETEMSDAVTGGTVWTLPLG